MRFAPARRAARWFWSNGYAWGTCAQRRAARGIEVELAVLHGSLSLRRLALTGFGQVEWKQPRVLSASRRIRVKVLRGGFDSE